MSAWATGAWATGAWADGAWLEDAPTACAWQHGAWATGAWADGVWQCEDTPAPPVVTVRRGGDDKVHPGWNRKRATLKRDRDLEFTEQIRDIYRDLIGDPRTADEAQAIVAAVTEPVRVKGESETAHEAALMVRAEAMRRRADAMDADAIQAEIALRLLHRNLLDTRDDDDMEAVEFLLMHVL